jgi:hypothetical protein
MTQPILIDIGMGDDGHRASYVQLLAKHFSAERKPFNLRSILSKKAVLFPLIEDSLAKYALASLIRSLLGRRTAGLLFRPRPALVGETWRLRIKYWILRILRSIPNVRTLTIVPFAVEPRFAEIANGWIYDLQLWDLELTDENPPGASFLVSEVRRAAAGRRVCLALGRQDESKGFDCLADMYIQHRTLHGALVLGFCGKVTSSLENKARELQGAGGFTCDRFLSEDELLAAYRAADLIWCAYAPDYDQASGILGRAVQFGIPVVVRAGSLIHRLCEIEGVRHIAISGPADWQPLTRTLLDEPTRITNARRNRMRLESLRRMTDALEAP